MLTPDHFVGVTDDGRPIVLSDGSCECFTRRENALLNSQSCWYCKYSDFRKSVDVLMEKSICRCPENRMRTILGSENEYLEEGQTK